jgi:hypothetical protein
VVSRQVAEGPDRGDLEAGGGGSSADSPSSPVGPKAQGAESSRRKSGADSGMPDPINTQQPFGPSGGNTCHPQQSPSAATSTRSRPPQSPSDATSTRCNSTAASAASTHQQFHGSLHLPQQSPSGATSTGSTGRRMPWRVRGSAHLVAAHDAD